MQGYRLHKQTNIKMNWITSFVGSWIKIDILLKSLAGNFISNFIHTFGIIDEISLSVFK